MVRVTCSSAFRWKVNVFLLMMFPFPLWLYMCLPCAPVLRPAFMLAQCTAPGRGMSSVAWRPLLSLMGHLCVCVALPLFFRPSLSDRHIKWSEREVGCVGLREERERGLRDLVPVIYRLTGMSHCFFLSVLILACMPTYCPTTQCTSCCWPRPSLAARVDRVSQAAHSWAPNLLSHDSPVD